MASWTHLGAQPNLSTPSSLPTSTGWVVTLPVPALGGGAVDQARVYLSLADGTLLALGRDTGLEHWRRALGAVAPPLRGDHGLWVPLASGVAAIDPLTGRTLWQANVAPVTAAPLVLAEGQVVATLVSGDVVSLNSQSGAIQWRQATAVPSAFPAAIARGMIYLVTGEQRLVALALADGAPRWSREFPGALQPPTAIGNRVLIGSDSNDLYALDGDTGRIAWRWRLGGDVIGAATDGTLAFVVSLDNQLRALRLSNGNQTWREALPSRPAFPPVVVADLVIVTSLNQELRAFGTQQGENRGTYRSPRELQHAPLLATAGATGLAPLIVVTKDQRVIAVTADAAPDSTAAPVPESTR